MTRRLVKIYSVMRRRCACCRAVVRPGERYVVLSHTGRQKRYVFDGMQHVDPCPRRRR